MVQHYQCNYSQRPGQSQGYELMHAQSGDAATGKLAVTSNPCMVVTAKESAARRPRHLGTHFGQDWAQIQAPTT